MLMYRHKTLFIVLHSGEKNGANVAMIRLLSELSNKLTFFTVRVFSEIKPSLLLEKFCKERQIEIENILNFYNEARYADIIFFNTVFTLKHLRGLKNVSAKMCCWIHETIPSYENYDSFIQNYFASENLKSNDAKKLFRGLDHIFFLGDLSRKSWLSAFPDICNNYCSVLVAPPGLSSKINQDIVNTSDKNPFHYCMIGSVCQRKNQLYALKIFKHLNDLGEKQFKLTIVGARNVRQGDQEYLNTLNSYINDNHLDSIIRIYPYTDTPSKHIKQCMYLLITSKSETFPLVIEECAREGVSTVSVNIGEISTYLPHDSLLCGYDYCKDADVLLDISMNRISNFKSLLQNINTQRVETAASFYETLRLL